MKMLGYCGKTCDRSLEPLRGFEENHYEHFVCYLETRELDFKFVFTIE